MTSTSLVARPSSAMLHRANEISVAAILEFESPTAALLAAPVPRAARNIIAVIASLVVVGLAALAIFPVDSAVIGRGRVVSTKATIVVQPLETSIVRTILVHEGQIVKAGEVLAKLDPTFAAADAGALEAQLSSFTAEVERLTAEAGDRPYLPSTANSAAAIQEAIYGQRSATLRYQIDSFDQKIASLESQFARAQIDLQAYASRLKIATLLEAKRRELERLKVGSQITRLLAEDERIEMQRNTDGAASTIERASRDIGQMKAERNAAKRQWKSQVNQELNERTRSLNEVRESLNKANLRRRLVELRADQDAIVLTIAKVSVGSVMQSGDQFVTLVPLNAPLEIESRIDGVDAGFVHPGQSVAIKFDTFPSFTYGFAMGRVRLVSADSFSGNGEDGRQAAAAAAERAPDTGNYFKTRIAIDEVKMHDVPGGFRLVPGMPVSGDIRVGERSVLSYLMARLGKVGAEGMREP